MSTATLATTTGRTIQQAWPLVEQIRQKVFFGAWLRGLVMRSMRGMVKTTIGISVLFLAATFTLSSCGSSGDTVVSVNYSFESAVTIAPKAAFLSKNGKKLHIKIQMTNDKGDSVGSPVETESDLDLKLQQPSDPNDPNAPQTDEDKNLVVPQFTYMRVTANSISGFAVIEVEARDDSGSAVLSGKVEKKRSDDKSVSDDDLIVAHAANAAYVTLKQSGGDWPPAK